MFKRLFFLSGIIAFMLACALMYFWYLPNHSKGDENATETQIEMEVTSANADSLKIIVPEE